MVTVSFFIRNFFFEISNVALAQFKVIAKGGGGWRETVREAGAMVVVIYNRIMAATP